MENVVSARRLRKSVLKDLDSVNLNLENDILLGRKVNIKDSIKSKEESLKIGFKLKFITKIFISIFIVFLCLIFNLIYPQICDNNKYINGIKMEYLKDYSKEDLLSFLEFKTKHIYLTTKFMIPENLANYINSKYNTNIKNKIINFNLNNLLQSNNLNNKPMENSQPQNNTTEAVPTEANGVGGGEPVTENTNNAEVKKDSSSTSIMQCDVNEILAKKINIINPVNGTVTSLYGAREQIFDNVNPYHTGIDIANVSNTDIISATDGKVTKTESNNKYYGNNILIETNGVTFKYAHLNSFNVKEGDIVKQGNLIGKMGSTGMSTGPHLHFEIRINGRTVDPSMILSF